MIYPSSATASGKVNIELNGAFGLTSAEMASAALLISSKASFATNSVTCDFLNVAGNERSGDHDS